MSKPISILYDRITDLFEAGHLPERLDRAIRNGQLSLAIFIDPEPNKIRTPFVDLEDHEIKLQETFLSYLWSICYCMIAFQQMTIDQSEEEIVKLKNSPEANTVGRMFEWAVSLRDTHTNWPKELPTPLQKGTRIVETNELFLFAIRYLMYHEVGHLVLHESSVEFIKNNRRSPAILPEDSRRLRQMEFQADEYAIDILLDAKPEDQHRYMNFLGAAVAHLSSLFLLEDDDMRGGRTHPDFDIRLKRLAKKATFNEQAHTLFFNVTISIGLQVFFERYGVHYLPPDSSSWRLQNFSDLFSLLYQKIDERKALYRQYRPFIG